MRASRSRRLRGVPARASTLAAAVTALLLVLGTTAAYASIAQKPDYPALSGTTAWGANGRVWAIVRMGDKHLHLAEKMVYERLLQQPLQFGIVHVVYRSDSFDEDVKKALASDATLISDVATVSAGFGERRVAFFRAPSGWIFEIIEILKNLVPEV